MTEEGGLQAGVCVGVAARLSCTVGDPAKREKGDTTLPPKMPFLLIFAVTNLHPKGQEFFASTHHSVTLQSELRPASQSVTTAGAQWGAGVP